MNKNELLAANCQPCEQALPIQTIETLLPHVAGWQLEAGFLTRNFLFDNFHQTMAFLNAVALIVHQQDHHPELRISYAQCKIHFNTHSAGGITENDFICAAKINALYAPTLN